MNNPVCSTTPRRPTAASKGGRRTIDRFLGRMASVACDAFRRPFVRATRTGAGPGWNKSPADRSPDAEGDRDIARKFEAWSVSETGGYKGEGREKAEAKGGSEEIHSNLSRV